MDKWKYLLFQKHLSSTSSRKTCVLAQIVYPLTPVQPCFPWGYAGHIILAHLQFDRGEATLKSLTPILLIHPALSALDSYPFFLLQKQPHLSAKRRSPYVYELDACWSLVTVRCPYHRIVRLGTYTACSVAPREHPTGSQAKRPAVLQCFQDQIYVLQMPWLLLIN